MPAIKRTIYIGSPAYLKVDKNRLVIENRESGESNILPIDDIGYLEFDNPQILINNYCLSQLSSKNIIVSVCGQDHHPIGYISSLEGNFLQAKRLKNQIQSSAPLKKSIWKQLIKFKIKNQARLLQSIGKDNLKILRLESKVRSGDPDNCEAQASRIYWTELFGSEFKRERYGDYPNNLLNYAYSIVRAITARAIVSTGLHPSLGVFHKNQYNAFCLADDLMEPFRPIADSHVFDIYSRNAEQLELDKSIKGELLQVAYIDCTIEGKTSPLSMAASICCSSLVKCFEGSTKELLCPLLKD